MKQIAGSVYLENELSVCNTSIVVTKDGVVVIDTPMVPADAKKVAAEIARFGPVRYVINTEPHGDHISGNCYFGGTLIAHEGTRDAILMVECGANEVDEKVMIAALDAGHRALQPIITLQEEMRAAVGKPKATYKSRPSEITFSEKLTLHLGGLTFRLMHLPGHSPHQVAVYIPEEKIVFTSDNVVRGVPFFRQSLPDKWLKTLKQMDQRLLWPTKNGLIHNK